MEALFFIALALAAPSQESLRDAEQLAAKAIVLWEEKAFVQAAERFLEAFELSGEPTQLRNAAKAYDAASLIDEARAAWNRLLLLPELTAADRQEAEDRLAAMTPATTATIAAPIARSVVVTPTAIETAPLAEPMRWEPWVLTAAGAVAAAVGGVLLFKSQRDLGALEDRLAIKENGFTVGIDYESAIAEERRIESWRIGSGTAIGIGIAAAIAGLSWWWFEW